MVRVWPAARPVMVRRASRPGPCRCSSAAPEGTPVITNLPAPSVLVARLVPVMLTRIPDVPDAWGTPAWAAAAPVTRVPWMVAPAEVAVAGPVGELVIDPEPHAAAPRPSTTANKK